jgi:hypothetical protein
VKETKMMMTRSTCLSLLLVAVVVAPLTTTLAQEMSSLSFDLLTEEILQISLIAAQLCGVAIGNGTEYVVGLDEACNMSTHDHPGYDAIQFYTEEPD